MATLTQQVKDLKNQLDMSRQIIDRQNVQINDLINQMQTRIEDTPMYKKTLETFQYSQTAAQPEPVKGSKADLQAQIAKLTAQIDELAGRHYIEKEKLRKDAEYWKDRSEQWERLYEISKTNQERLQGLLKESEKEPEPRKRGPKQKADGAKRQEIRELRKQGLSFKAIADQTGMSKTQVFAICKEIPND